MYNELNKQNTLQKKIRAKQQECYRSLNYLQKLINDLKSMIHQNQADQMKTVDQARHVTAYADMIAKERVHLQKQQNELDGLLDVPKFISSCEQIKEDLKADIKQGLKDLFSGKVGTANDLDELEDHSY